MSSLLSERLSRLGREINDAVRKYYRYIFNIRSGVERYIRNNQFKVILIFIWRREHDILIDEDVEPVAGSDLEGGLNVKVFVDSALGDAAECLGEIATGGIGRCVLGRQRRALRDSHVHAGADDSEQDRGAECLEVVVVDLVLEASITFCVSAGHAANLEGRAVREDNISPDHEHPALPERYLAVVAAH